MHVGIVTPNLHGGGAEAIARQWIGAMRADGHRVSVYAYDREQPSVQLAPGVLVHRLPARGGALRPALMPRWLSRCVASDRPDVVLSLMTFSNVIALLALKRHATGSVPLMVSEHNVQSLQRRNVGRRERVTLRLARRLYPRAEGALAVSHPVAAELVSAFGVERERVFVVPNPVVEAVAGAGAGVQPPRSLHLVLVGRHARQKRPLLFLDVLGELAARGIEVRGSVVGDGPLRGEIEARARELGLDVSFLGWREPWWESVSDVDCLVLTANAEGLANVLVEAAAAGIPAVAASQALGVADAIVPGITGALAPRDSPAGYADAVLEAARLDLRAPVRIESWLARFSTANSAATLMKALETIAR